MSFSPEYDIINATTENQHNENISLDFVLQRLLNAKALKGVKIIENLHTPVLSDNAAFNANKKIGLFKSKQKGHVAKKCKTRINCYNCGRADYVKRDCRMKIKPNSKNESAAVTFMTCEAD